MARLEIRALTQGDLPEAGRLLAERHRRHRLAQPLLSARYEDPASAEAEVTEAWTSHDASGAVAVRDGAVVGFLLGAPKPSDPWGPNVWVEAAGQAADDPETMRDLYAHAATRWVEEGRTAQYVLVPAHDHDLMRAWYQLGFGQQQAHALRDVEVTAPSPPPGITIRSPRREDISALARLELELPAHQGRSPTFSAGRVPTLEETLAEWEEDFDDEGFATFVAEREGRVVGSAVGCAVERSSVHRGPARPDQAALLGFAAVFPRERGRGLGRALGEAVLAWAGEAGFRCVVTDWRTTNLLSSRTWPGLGFAESFVRLHRLIGY